MFCSRVSASCPFVPPTSMSDAGIDTTSIAPGTEATASVSSLGEGELGVEAAGREVGPESCRA